MSGKWLLEKLQLKAAYFDTVKSICLDTTVPRHMQLLDPELTGEGRSDIMDYNEEEISQIMAVVNRIVKKCSDKPEGLC